MAFKAEYPSLCVNHESGDGDSVKIVDVTSVNNNNDQSSGQPSKSVVADDVVPMDTDETQEATRDTVKYHPSRDQVSLKDVLP